MSWGGKEIGVLGLGKLISRGVLNVGRFYRVFEFGNGMVWFYFLLIFNGKLVSYFVMNEGDIFSDISNICDYVISRNVFIFSCYFIVVVWILIDYLNFSCFNIGGILFIIRFCYLLY